MGLLLGKKKKDKMYYKLGDFDMDIYVCSPDIDSNSIEFSPDIKLENNEWFFIENFSYTPYCPQIFSEEISTATLDKLSEIKNTDLDILVELQGNLFLFQKITSSKVICNKKFLRVFSAEYRIKDVQDSIEINVIPSAIFDKGKNRLYFRKFSAITSIFDNIIELFREATNEEVSNFLSSDFIQLVDFSGEDVKTENRKRISLLQSEISEWKESERQTIIEYIHEYASELSFQNNSFLIHDEKELRLLIWGLSQRFFTTKIGNKKYIANSVRNL